MLKTRKMLPIPSKTVVEDLVSRGGSPTSESPSPYKGVASDITKKFEGTHLSVVELFTNYPDYNPIQQKPAVGAYLADYRDESNRLKTLEEIDSSWVYAYINQLVYSVREYKNNGLRAKLRNDLFQTTLVDSEDGSVTTESDLMEIDYNFSFNEINHWDKFVPYVVRRMHDKSKEVGISIISLVRGYTIFELKNNNNKIARGYAYHRSVQPAQLVQAGVYYMSPQGEVTEHVTKPADRKLVRALKWYKQSEDRLVSEIRELLNILARMSIDLSQEDVSIYNESYIRKLSINYIVSNQKYMLNKTKAVNYNVLTELRKLPLEVYNKNVTEKETLKSNFQVNQSIMKNFSQVPNIGFSFSRKETLPEDYRKQFEHLWWLLFKKDLQLSKLMTSDGFYMITQDQPLIADVTSIATDFVNATNMYALVHSAGYLVLRVDIRLGYMYYLDFEKAYTYLYALHKTKGNIEEAKRRSMSIPNELYGKWNRVLI